MADQSQANQEDRQKEIAERIKTLLQLQEIIAEVMPLNERLAYASRQLPDGRMLDVFPLTFGRGRLCLSRNMRADWCLDEW